MSSLRLNYSWGNLDDHCNMLATMCALRTKPLDRVIAIGEDLIPAKLIADRLGLPVKQLLNNNELQMISNPLNSGTGELSDLPRLIFVFSYVNDEFPEELISAYAKVGHEIEIVSLFSSLHPICFDYVFNYNNFVPEGTQITFPWKL